jgi:AraC family transcriptional activator FtrA
MSHCTGIYVLAASGLVDGRTVATHWRAADDVRRRFPAVTVDPDVPLRRRRPDLHQRRAPPPASTPACTSCAASTERAWPAPVARRMVVPPHRDGGQSQYAPCAVPDLDDTSRLHETLVWAQDNLATDLTVDQLAAGP